MSISRAKGLNSRYLILNVHVVQTVVPSAAFKYW